MASVTVAEYADCARLHGPLLMGKAPVVAEQILTIGAGSVASNAFNAKTRVIRVHADAQCAYVVNGNPTATANNAHLAAGETEYFEVVPGHKIAVITFA